MEILPGVGVAQAKIGDRRDEVEKRLGPPHPPAGESRVAYGDPPFVLVTYAEDDTVELVELASGGEEVFFDGVQLTHRLINDVVADLTARGHGGEPIDAGYRFEAGFALVATGSPSAADDHRPISAAVSVGPYEAFRDPGDEDFRTYLEGQQAKA